MKKQYKEVWNYSLTYVTAGITRSANVTADLTVDGSLENRRALASDLTEEFAKTKHIDPADCVITFMIKLYSEEVL